MRKAKKLIDDSTFIFLQAMAMAMAMALAKDWRKLYNLIVFIKTCHRVVKIFNTFHHINLYVLYNFK